MLHQPALSQDIALPSVVTPSSMVLVVQQGDRERQHTSCTTHLWLWKNHLPLEMPDMLLCMPFQHNQEYHKHFPSNKQDNHVTVESLQHFVVRFQLCLAMRKGPLSSPGSCPTSHHKPHKPQATQAAAPQATKDSLPINAQHIETLAAAKPDIAQQLFILSWLPYKAA